MGACDTGWTGAMGLIDGVCHGDTRHWNREMALIYGDALWGHAIWGDRIDLWWHTIGVQCWLDLGIGIELWGRTMGVRDTG